MIIGALKEIWQYPVKSLGGTQLGEATITPAGLSGDRCWAVIDTEKNEIRSAKKWPALLNMSAALQTQLSDISPAYDDAIPAASIRLPSGEQFGSRDEDADRKVSDFLGKPARIAPLAPPWNKAHYQIAGERNAEDFVSEMGLLDGEAFPDFSATPEDLLKQLAENATPPGTYFDAFPLHLLTTNSLRYLSERGKVDAVIQRFRANFLVEPTEALQQLTENGWVGKRLQIGEAIVVVNSKTVRCSMPSREQQPHKLHAEKGMARAMVDHVERQLGINMLVEKAGACRLGDKLVMLD